MEYTYDQWIQLVLPYPTLSREFGNNIILNSIMTTKVPGLVIGCIPSIQDDNIVHLDEFLVYYNEQETLLFNNDIALISTFRNSYNEMDEESKKVIMERLQAKFSSL